MIQLSDSITNAEHKIVDLIAQRDEDLLAIKAVWKASDNMIEESLQRMERVYVLSFCHGCGVTTDGDVESRCVDYDPQRA